MASSDRKKKQDARMVLYGSAGLAVDPMPFAMPEGSWRYLLNGDFSQTSARTPAGLSSGGMRVRGGLAPLLAAPLGNGPIMSMGAVPLSSPFGGVAPPPVEGGTLYVRAGTAAWLRGTPTSLDTVTALSGLTSHLPAAGFGALWFADPTIGLQRWDGSTLTTVVSAAAIEGLTSSFLTSIIPLVAADGRVTVAIFQANEVASTSWVGIYTLDTDTFAAGDPVVQSVGAGVIAQAVHGPTAVWGAIGDTGTNAPNDQVLRIYRWGITGGAPTVAAVIPPTDPAENPGGFAWAWFNGQAWVAVIDPTVAPKIYAGDVTLGLHTVSAYSGATYPWLWAAQGQLFAAHARVSDVGEILRSGGGGFVVDYDFLAATGERPTIRPGVWQNQLLVPVPGADLVARRSITGEWSLLPVAVGGTGVDWVGGI